MLTLNKLRLQLGKIVHVNGEISDFVRFVGNGSILNTNVIQIEYGVDFSLEFEEPLSVLNTNVIHITRGTDASLMGR